MAGITSKAENLIFCSWNMSLLSNWLMALRCWRKGLTYTLEPKGDTFQKFQATNEKFSSGLNLCTHFLNNDPLMADWTCEKPVKKQYIYSNMTVFDTWGTHSCRVKADITGVFSPAATTIVSSLRHRNIWRIFMNKSISAAANKNIYHYASNRL